ncbi:MAG TPA: PLP-dependent cysteine synthase family protein [Anaerolineae bacterium]|nr:PLP-dependent cysteine synthase family protein [Anaerolineae bacterium]HMR67614.1 PLP-dependent cysteine synthase family protein [Anaerolineae bacterium]
MTLIHTMERVHPKTINLTQPAALDRRQLGDSITSRIGNTPLLPLHKIAAAEGVAPNVVIYAKAEWFNAGGSVKARPALAMIEDGERRGLLTSDKTIIDATSGNTGIALAMIGAARGYKVSLVMPANVSDERKKILKAYGAELILTDPVEGIDLSIKTAHQLADAEPEKYFRPDQYNNPANWQAHYHTTGVEIWNQTHGLITHFVAGLGTSGTFMGTTRRLKGFNAAIQAVSIQPADELAIIEGLKHMETSLVPGIYDPGLADQTIEIWPEDARTITRRLAREEGLFVGYSAGAAVWAAMELAKTLTEDSLIVTILPDGGEKYLSLAD